MTVGGSTGSNLSGVQALYDASSTGKKAPLGRGRGLRQRPDRKDPRDHKNCLCFRARRPDLHAGDTQYIYDHTESVGFLGASSAERIPIEGPLEDAVRQFKSAKLRSKHA